MPSFAEEFDKLHKQGNELVKELSKALYLDKILEFVAEWLQSRLSKE